MSVFTVFFLFFFISQLYWAWRGYRFAAARIRPWGLRLAVCGAVLVIYTAAYQFNFGGWRDRSTPVHLTPGDAFVAAPFLWWAASSLVAFLLAVVFAVVKAMVALVRRMLAPRPAEAVESPERRKFLER